MLLLVLAVAACGVPSSPKDQAEEVHSIAAEGAILAHDAAEGDTTATFTGVHAAALRKRLDTLRPKIVDPSLARIDRRAAEALRRLEADPFGADVEDDLDESAQAAEELAK